MPVGTDYKCDGSWAHLEGVSLWAGLLGIILIWLVEVTRITVKEDSKVPWAGLPKGSRKQHTSIQDALLTKRGCSGTRCLNHLQLGIPWHDGLYPQTVSPSKPFPL